MDGMSDGQMKGIPITPHLLRGRELKKVCYKGTALQNVNMNHLVNVNIFSTTEPNYR